jgi:glycosyltransferase involved in cell wall biosynthesis
MPEIIEATGGGVLVEKNNPAALADAIIRLLAAPEASAKMGRRGAKRVAELYPWRRIAALTQDLHGEALSVRRWRNAAAG